MARPYIKSVNIELAMIGNTPRTVGFHGFRRVGRLVDERPWKQDLRLAVRSALRTTSPIQLDNWNHLPRLILTIIAHPLSLYMSESNYHLHEPTMPLTIKGGPIHFGPFLVTSQVR